MATLSAVARANLSGAINLLVGSSAYETPFAEDVIDRLGKSVEGSGFMSRGAVAEACKLNPISTLLKWVSFLDAQAGPTPASLPGFVVATSGDVVLLSSPASVAAVVNDLLFWNDPALSVATADLLTSVGGIVMLNTAPFLTSFRAAALGVIGGSLLYLGGPLEEIGLPSLTTAGTIEIAGADSLVEFSLPLITESTGGIFISAAGVLQQVSLPSFTGATTFGIGINDCPALSQIDLSAWTPPAGGEFAFTNDALSAATVELMLHRFVVAGTVGVVLDVSGGTSAGLASLSVQGQADYAAAIVATNSITINP